MAAIDNHRLALAEKKSEGSPYSVRRSVAIIAGLSLSFWSLVGLVIYELL
jgi:hypothetical protein